MKKAIIQSFITVFLVLLGFQHVSACGTVPGWRDNYMRADRNEDRLNALKFIHCEPVLALYAKNKTKEMPLLVDLLEQAITDLDSQKLSFDSKPGYAHNLIWMNLIRFRVLEDSSWMSSRPIQQFIRDQAKEANLSPEKLIQRIQNLPPKSPWYTYEGMSLDARSYATALQGMRTLLFRG